MLFCCLFKQKTAYEMRISDWSSDVCSSDLLILVPHTIRLAQYSSERILGRAPRRKLGRVTGAHEGIGSKLQGNAGWNRRFAVGSRYVDFCHPVTARFIARLGHQREAAIALRIFMCAINQGFGVKARQALTVNDYPFRIPF